MEGHKLDIQRLQQWDLTKEEPTTDLETKVFDYITLHYGRCIKRDLIKAALRILFQVEEFRRYFDAFSEIKETQHDAYWFGFTHTITLLDLTSSDTALEEFINRYSARNNITYRIWLTPQGRTLGEKFTCTDLLQELTHIIAHYSNHSNGLQHN